MKIFKQFPPGYPSSPCLIGKRHEVVREFLFITLHKARREQRTTNSDSASKNMVYSTLLVV